MFRERNHPEVMDHLERFDIAGEEDCAVVPILVDDEGVIGKGQRAVRAVQLAAQIRMVPGSPEAKSGRCSDVEHNVKISRLRGCDEGEVGVVKVVAKDLDDKLAKVVCLLGIPRVVEPDVHFKAGWRIETRKNPVSNNGSVTCAEHKSVRLACPTCLQLSQMP